MSHLIMNNNITSLSLLSFSHTALAISHTVMETALTCMDKVLAVTRQDEEGLQN